MKYLYVFAVTSLISCASPQVTMFGNFSYRPTANIDVYQTKKPTQEYIEIAKISCGDSDDDWNLKEIKRKAMEIGADAIIIIGRSGVTLGSIPMSKNYTYTYTSEYRLVAIAIKYK